MSRESRTSAWRVVFVAMLVAAGYVLGGLGPAAFCGVLGVISVTIAAGYEHKNAATDGKADWRDLRARFSRLWLIMVGCAVAAIGGSFLSGGIRTAAAAAVVSAAPVVAGAVAIAAMGWGRK